MCKVEKIALKVLAVAFVACLVAQQAIIWHSFL
jgi:hypothetical protein